MSIEYKVFGKSIEYTTFKVFFDLESFIRNEKKHLHLL